MVSKFTGEHQKIKSIHSRPRERLTVVKVLSMERLQKKFQNPQVKFFPYDIYICGYNLLIEIDGKQHFEKIDYFEQGNYTFEKRVNRDNLKNNFAFINDIPILRIPYIYYAPQNRGQIERIIKEFISTRKVPDDILDYYKKLRFSNYYEIGHRLNEFQGGYNLMTNPC